MNELVSIIVPIYNVSEYLEKCIMSLINQTYKNIEIILVNDGSTDNSLDICKKYETEDKRIVVLNKINGGLSDARNYGIERAKGKYITCVDSDDYVTDDYVEFMYNNLKKDDADISICKHIVLFDNNTQISTATHKKYILNPKDTLEMLLYDEDMDVSAVAKLYKKELFEGIKYPKGQLFEDAATTYKLIDKASKITFESEGKYFYIIRQDSITNRRFDERKADLIKSTKQMTEYIRNKYPELKQGCDRRDMYAYLSTLMQMTKEKDIKKHSKLQNEIMTYIKSNRSKILKDKRIPKRDRMALISTFLGYRGFKTAWNIYQNILRKREKINHEQN